METLNTTLNALKNSDHVKIILPSGAYLQGKKKKVQRNIQQINSDLVISKTEIGYIPVPFRINLQKEVIIYTC